MAQQSLLRYYNFRSTTVSSRRRSAPFLANRETDIGTSSLPTGITTCRCSTSFQPSDKICIAYIYYSMHIDRVHCLPFRQLIHQNIFTLEIVLRVDTCPN